MRVLYVIDSLAPGGAETSLAALAPGLIAGGVELEVAYFHERDGVAPQLRAAGARLTHLGPGRGRLDRIRAVRRLVRERRPDLVHTTLFEADVAGRVGARLAHTRTPVVSSIVNEAYGPEHRSVPGMRGSRVRLAHALDAASARLVTRFHANGEAVAQVMAPRLRVPAGKIDVVHRGRDAAHLGTRAPERRAAVRARLGVDDAIPLVLAVGRQDAQKGFDVLVQALPALVAAVPDVRVVVAGREGDQTALLQQSLAALPADVAARIRFLGQRDDVADLLAAADVLAHPTRREGLPGTLIEAIALECPVVASDLPTVREVVCDCAALVPAGDADALAAAVVGVLRDGPPPGATARGRARFLEHFTLEGSAAGMLAFYRRVLSERPTRSDGAAEGEVLVVVTSTDRRGAEIEGAELAAALRARGRAAAAVALAPGRVGGLDVPVLGATPLAPSTLRALRRRARGAGTVLAYGSSTLPACAIALAGSRTRWVYRSIGDPTRWAGGRLRRERTGLLLRRAERVVALWPGAADDLRALYRLRPDRLAVVANGRDADRFRPPSPDERAAARDALGIAHDAAVVVFVGALSSEKEPETAVQAVASLPDVHLVVAGDGPLRATVDALAHDRLPGRAHVLGMVDDVVPVFHAADVLVLTSRTEGMPGVVIEAALCGLPVVASDVGGLGDLVLDGRTGRLVAPGDVRGVAAALEESIGRRLPWGEAARAHCESRYASGPVLDAWVDLLTAG